MINLPQPVQEGIAVSAAWLNQLLAAVRAVSAIGAGPGINLTRGPMGLLISAPMLGAEWRRGVISAVHQGPSGLADSLTYDVKVVGIEQLYTNAMPRLYRPGQGAVRLVPAAVGDPCFVLTVPNGDGTFEAWLAAPTESIAFAQCGGGVGPGVGPGAAPAGSTGVNDVGSGLTRVPAWVRGGFA